jgi:transketolase C-terminal domain/subunit
MRALVSALADAALSDPHLVLLTDGGADDAAFKSFRAMLPEQCYDVDGSADAMIGVAAGLAMNDHRVFVFATEPMMTFRTCEFLRREICRNQLSVAIIAGSSGDAEGRENLLQTLPGMRVMVVRDAKDARAAVALLARSEGPCVVSISS